MTLELFLDKFLRCEFGGFDRRDLEIIKFNKKLFGVGKGFDSLMENIKDESLSDETRERVINTLKEELFPRTVVIKSLDDNKLVFGGEELDFKARFFDNLSRMNNLQMCYLIDKICFLLHKNKLGFFGGHNNDESVYHQLNEVISKSYGLDLVFGVFGVNQSKNFLPLQIDRFDNRLFIECLRRNVRNYFCILSGLSDVILGFKEDELPNKSLAYAIGKKVNIFINSIKEEKKLFTNKGKKFEKKWVYSDSELLRLSDVVDEGDDGDD